VGGSAPIGTTGTNLRAHTARIAVAVTVATLAGALALALAVAACTAESGGGDTSGGGGGTSGGGAATTVTTATGAGSDRLDGVPDALAGYVPAGARDVTGAAAGDTATVSFSVSAGTVDDVVAPLLVRASDAGFEMATRTSGPAGTVLGFDDPATSDEAAPTTLTITITPGEAAEGGWRVVVALLGPR
jgi:hypothetical protein